MLFRRLSPAALAATLALGTAAVSLAADDKPSGTVTIEETQFAMVLGGSVGGGKLSFQGKTYDFKLGGLTAGANVGISKVSAAGEVYNLKDVAQFPGTYTKLDAGVAVAGGVSALQLRNQHGVVMKLTSRTQGLQLNVGSASGVSVTMK